MACPVPSSTAPLVTLNGSNGSGRVLTISGANSVVTLRHLIVTGGNAPSGSDGGGIGFAGTGRLNLFTTAVNYNNANYGGGINFKGTGNDPSTAVLTLFNESLIVGNTAAVSGGGIRIEGEAVLIADNPRTLITFNTASTGFGGGIEVIGPAEAHIGSPGYNGAPVVSQNEARYGGGIAVVGGQDVGWFAQLHLYSVSPAQPVAVSGNAAEVAGGGLYLLPFYDQVPTDTVGHAQATVYHARLDDNSAPDGAVAYLDHDVGGLGGTVGSTLTFTDEPAPRGYPCQSGAPCISISGNKTRTLNAVPAPDGALIGIRNGSRFLSNRFAFLDNEAGYAVRSETGDSPKDVYMRNCLIANNTLGKGVLRTFGNPFTSLHLTGCTVTANAIASGPVIYGRDGDLLLNFSIIDQPGVQTLDFIGSPVQVQYVLATEIASLPPADHVVQGAPLYLDAAGENFQLRHDSPGLDFGPNVAAEGERALNGVTRVWDLSGVPDQFGPRDLGAYERVQEPPPNTIFSDSFETGSGGFP
jgi:hypothetical protein